MGPSPYRQWGDILYFIILLLILLFILYPILSSSYQSYKSKTSDEEELEELEGEDDQSTDNDNYNSTVKYDKYEEYPHEFDLHSVRSSDINTDNDQSEFTYKDLKNIYSSTEFLNNYRSALKISFKEKQQKYNIMLKQLERDIKSAQSRHDDGNGILSPHDTSLERLKRLKSEVNSIINIINYRLKNNNIKNIKSNFESMFSNSERGEAKGHRLFI